MLKTCTCGRIGEHCPNADCGSISKAPLKQRTAIISRQLGLDVRYYTCRKCGVEYGWLNGSLYDSECYAPKEIRIVATPQSIEQEVKDLNECIQFIQARGGVIDFPNGIKEVSNEKEAGDNNLEQRKQFGSDGNMRPDFSSSIRPEGTELRSRMEEPDINQRSEIDNNQKAPTFTLEEIEKEERKLGALFKKKESSND